MLTDSTNFLNFVSEQCLVLWRQTIRWILTYFWIQSAPARGQYGCIDAIKLSAYSSGNVVVHEISHLQFLNPSHKWSYSILGMQNSADNSHMVWVPVVSPDSVRHRATVGPSPATRDRSLITSGLLPRYKALVTNEIVASCVSSIPIMYLWRPPPYLWYVLSFTEPRTPLCTQCILNQNNISMGQNIPNELPRLFDVMHIMGSVFTTQTRITGACVHCVSMFFVAKMVQLTFI